MAPLKLLVAKLMWICWAFNKTSCLMLR